MAWCDLRAGDKPRQPAAFVLGYGAVMDREHMGGHCSPVRQQQHREVGVPQYLPYFHGVEVLDWQLAERIAIWKKRAVSMQQSSQHAARSTQHAARLDVPRSL
jgi:hypothetical protein